MQLKPGSKLQNGKYEILRVLGQGGFGITYLAEQVALHRKVAVKEFFMKEYCERDESTSYVTLGATAGSKELVARFRTKFIREAQMIAALEHPHIVKIHDVFEENGTAYYVMEFLEGDALSDKVKKSGPLPEEEALKYIRQVGDALSYLHQQNCLHFDVKPSNILVNKLGNAVLIDFGVSKHYDQGGSQTSSTPVGISKGYAPMEQYQQAEISTFTPATDIYALGATLYTLVTGQVPPSASEIYEDGVPPMPERISATTRAAIEKAMQPRRKDRPQRVDSFLNMLETPPLKAKTPRQEPEEDESTRVFVKNPPKKVVKAPKEEPQKPKSNNEQLPLFTKICLIIGLLIGAGVIFFAASFVYYDIEDGDKIFRFIAVILGLIGAIVAEVGVVLLLCRWKMGYWLLAAGGFVCAFFEFFIEPDDYLIGVFLALLLIVDGVTFGVLAIKNKNGIKGWDILRKGRPKPESKLWKWWPWATLAIIGILLIVFKINNRKETTGYINDHEWVDLGLSVKWATCNVGTFSPSDSGDYYAWGETSTKNEFTWANYKWCSGDYEHLTKYNTDSSRGECDNILRLEWEDDPVHPLWGYEWRMPTDYEISELVDQCSWSWTEYEGRMGYQVTGKNGNSIFLPAAGSRDINTSDTGVYGYYWSSSLEYDYPVDAKILYITSDGASIDSFNRDIGITIRPVTDY